jgi:uncharacterized peroxidase-related enzyme
MVPNVIRTLANSQAVLDAFLAFSSRLEQGVLPADLRELIAVAVSEANGCEYCLAAHSAFGKAAGLSEEEITDGRRGTSPDRRVEAVLRFVRAVIEKRGWVSDDDLARLRGAGYSDEEIVEIMANVALNMFTNYFNHVVDTIVDFPRVHQLI